MEPGAVREGLGHIDVEVKSFGFGIDLGHAWLLFDARALGSGAGMP
jgi:hypothetical protein